MSWNEIRENRREVLASKLPNDCVFILDSDPERMISHGVEINYRPNSDLYYYTGITEPHTTFVLVKDDGNVTSHVFVRDHDISVEQWVGRYLGPDGAQDLGFEHTHPNTELNIIETFMKKYVYYCCPDPTSTCTKIIEDAKKNNTYEFIDARPIAEAQRVIKAPEEIDLLRKAVEISAKAHKRVIANTTPGTNERKADALFTYHVSAEGCDRLAYPCIVAGGVNALTLHYLKNNVDLQEGDLCLMDAGGEYQHYAADITRTWPVSGKFTAAQRRVYDAVLQVQTQCINMVEPGANLMDINKVSYRSITAALIELGLLSGDLDALVDADAHRRFYPHSIGHWLGMDVHDCLTYSRQDNELQPGMVLTIEPGIYIPTDDDIPEEYRGIGIRIEDDILVTTDGHEVLSDGITKDPDVLEALAQSN